MKKTDMERLKAAHIRNQMKQSPIPERFAAGSQKVLDRRGQRELDRARGLVPFAVKIPAELASQLRALAAERQADPNDLVTELLKKGLAAK
ncbi:MAG: hypothetical protein ACT4P4_03095 [Betaproteobacteria bacterium]